MVSETRAATWEKRNATDPDRPIKVKIYLDNSEEKVYEYCIVCGGLFSNTLWTYKPKYLPINVCGGCCRRDKWLRFARLKEALEKIAEFQCVRGYPRWEPAPDCDVIHPYGEDGWRPASEGHEHWIDGTDCGCPTCTADRVYNELFPEAHPSEMETS